MADAKTIRMTIEADPRLAAAAGGAARYFADAAGLDTAAITSWQKAIVSACIEAFTHLTPEHPRLDVALTRTADRLEVALSREGESSPAIGLDSLAGLTQQSPPGTKGAISPVLGGVDRVQYETRAGLAVTRLTKFITPTTPHR